MIEKITFCSPRKNYGYMSNFAHYPVNCSGKTWKTSEHAYQAHKFINHDEASVEDVWNAPSAIAAAIIGRDPQRIIRTDWEIVKVDVMRFVVMHKFLQNNDIKNELLATGNIPIYEFSTKGDKFWGIDKTGVGQNMLGRILMEIRAVIAADVNNTSSTLETDIFLTSLKM
jgi:ribA/ribD-fused uncharacterized protein